MERDREFVSLRWVVVGILTGIVGGLLLSRAGGTESPLFGVVGQGADLFICLLRMVIVPLVVASLISAVAGLDTRYLGRLGVITLVYYTNHAVRVYELPPSFRFPPLREGGAYSVPPARRGNLKEGVINCCFL